MKKIAKSLLLTAALFSMAACSAPVSSVNSVDNGNIPGPAYGNDETLAITYVNDDAVTVNGPATAVSGSKVTFTVSYDSEEYVIDEIKVDNVLPFSEGNNSFSFRMPESAATVTISGHYTDPNHGKFRINNANADKGVVLFGANEYASEGEEVSFTVKFAYDSPYTFTGSVTVTGVSTDEAVLVSMSNDVYSFTMPKDAVSVNVGLEANQYKITITNTEKSNNFAGTPFSILGEDETYKTLTAEYFDTYNVYYVSYGETIRAKVKKSSDRLVVEGLRLIGGALHGNTSFEELVEVPEEDYYYVTFQMPAYDVTAEAFGAVNYKTVTVVNSEHFQATLQSKVDDEYVDITDATQIIPGDVVYVAISNIGEPDPDFEFEKVTLSDGYLSTDTAGSLYHFTMSNKDGVTVTVSEKNMAQYKNCDFVGTHYGANLYLSGANKSSKANSSYDVIIGGDGSVKRGPSSYTISSYEEVNNGSFGLITTIDNKEFAYSGKFIFGHYSFSSKNSAAFGKDWIVSVAPQSSTDTRDNYKFYYRVDNDKTFIAVQAFRVVDDVETLYASMIYDSAYGELYSKDVQFSFTTGEKVSESDAAYSITYGDAVIGKVENGDKFTSFVPHPQALTVVNSTHYGATIYDGDTLLTDTSAINAGTTLTVKLALVDLADGLVEGTDFIFNKLSFSAGDPAVTTVTANREFTFAMPKADTTLTVVEKDLTAFKDYPFLGNFCGNNLYGSAQQKKDATMDAKFNLNVTNDGTLVKGTSTNYTIVSATSKTGDGFATLSNTYDFAYSDMFIFGHYNFSNKNSNAYGKDYIVAVKKSDASDANSLYKYNWQMGNNKNFISVEAYRDGALYAVMFYDAVNHIFYGNGLSFEFLDEKTTVGESTNYNVKVNDAVIGTVLNGAYTAA